MKKRKKLGAERLSEFFRQFSVLVESGLSIPETLEIMQQDDTDREFCLACRKLGAFMTEGKTVGDAMEETGRFRSSLRSGVNSTVSGCLPSRYSPSIRYVVTS